MQLSKLIKGKIMKKALLIIVVTILSLCSASLYSAEPLVKFYLQDGSTKQYNLSDIDSLNVIDKKNNYVMRIHYQDTFVAYYPTEIIGSIKFEMDSATRDILNVYIFSYPKSYILSSIDSVIFYIDQYQPLTIGSQVWMLKNLNVDHFSDGDSIREVTDPNEWATLKTGAWCYYNNDPAMGAIYGKLYNWFAVNDSRGLSPKGWHIPTDEEWSTLVTYLGGESVAGGKIKETGTSHWFNPNTEATNESGFTALPGGRCYYNGAFDNIGFNSGWWSSTESSPSNAWYRYLYCSSASVGRFNGSKESGFSVRCIKNN
jgi:uncharacterized protein (TIGR02145 family)